VLPRMSSRLAERHHPGSMSYALYYDVGFWI
jgi:hypothetical protein